jgi:hypothetical protein
MTKDYRLDLGRYIDYTNDIFAKKKKLNFDDLFAAKASSGTSPWMPSRFEGNDLVRKLQTRKLRLNPSLNFVGEQPEEYEVFAGLGRFKRQEDYDFQSGRPNTRLRPEEQPGYTPLWKEAYELSPTMDPGRRISNPMPRATNPDPKGYLMAMAERRVENEVEGNMSVAQLLQEDKGNSKEKEKEAKKEEAKEEKA